MAKSILTPKERQERDRARAREYMRQKIAADRDAWNAKSREYRAQNLEKRRKQGREGMRRYMAKDREAYNIRRREKYAANKERWVNYNSQYVNRIGRDVHNERQRAQYEKHKEKRRAAKRLKRIENPEVVLSLQRKYSAANRDKINERQRRYYAEKVEYRLLAHYHERLRAARKKQRALASADKKIMREIFKKRPSGYDIDHIVPITGFTPDGNKVSGLHVQWNLQYLLTAENDAKKSRMRESDLAFALIPEPVLHPSVTLLL